ncbi:superoxide dismutase [Sporosarcina sp. P37]|uniref:superoxide dismutase family protein n=1 Tax=unclassified Sporosarcina TaxID=2647733 RepID=UPI0009C1A091|nr:MULTISPECIES: superoxide dismutase family protein [unclassified Sporosarcina]ARD48591.1 superoxide dismutase [Sporosarcina sp. P33]ARK25098.1 superoxide dismutase [Sporosarcina sp. P37]PID17910.1 superoxide dismutase family protein [Sporosarcina sp. P35]
MWKLSSMVLGAALLTAACGSASEDEKVPVNENEETPVEQENAAEPEITAPVMNVDGEEIGTVTLTEGPTGVAMDLDVTGLEPGEHGMHFHETGVCTAPDFKASAGGHFNPTGKQHGMDNPEGHHAGDLENIVADEDGNAKVSITAEEVTLESGKENSLLDEDGSALIIHEGADDYKTDPAGDSGSPFACAEITSENMK